MENQATQHNKHSITTQLRSIYASFSPVQVLAVWTLSAIILCALFTAGLVLQSPYLLTIPVRGGEIREGLIGTPRFINPVLAATEQDKDLTHVVFSGLTRRSPDDTYTNDLAEVITPSDDGLEYRVLLKQNLTFHDGSPLTADDVIFTYLLVQDPAIKSPYRVLFEGIEMSRVSDSEILFTLKKPYPLLLATLSLGILPKHVWKDIPVNQFSLSDINIYAIGAGPYLISDVSLTSGIPREFTLASFRYQALGRPYLDTIIITAYQNEKSALAAMKNKEIDMVHNISYEKTAPTLALDKNLQLSTSTLPRVVTLFFNVNKTTILSNKTVRLALAEATNRQEIVSTVLHGYGKVATSPFAFETSEVDLYNPDDARALLGQSAGTSSLPVLTISTANTDEMREVAELITTQWGQVGIHVEVNYYETADLYQAVIKNRDFEILLYPSITESPEDLYAFWHSSQRTHPGLNVSGYVSKQADQALTVLKESRDESERRDAYSDITEELRAQNPALFLYAPYLTYITSRDVTISVPSHSKDVSSRFDTINEWYMYSEHVWPFSIHNTISNLLENYLH